MDASSEAGATASPAVGRVVRLFRYLVKGMTPEALPEVPLHPGDGVPGDRVFALARPDTMFDEDDPEVLPKSRFVMLQKDEALARIRTSFDPASGTLAFGLGEPAARAGDGPGDVRRVDLNTPAGRAELEDYVLTVLGPRLGGRPRLVAARGRHRFTDTGGHGDTFMHAVSVINLASVRDLAERVGEPVDPLRFRANVYIDGIAPWAELGWAGLELGLGAARARVLARTPRCAATTVNPETGIRDIRILKELSSNYGHTDCGVYVTVLTEAILRPGDPLTPPDGREEDVLCGS
ncbi:MOSC domain-containing protein [Parafrankia discariae]|uniref:MOSC domain-containing protein n=1 Tax=Parafrankia discariae TaxID=365528 RepID=UPI000367AF00|nr:MOSC domain-containing protein [Parafrankia discariae]